MATLEDTTWSPRIEPNARPARYRSTGRWLERGAGRQEDGIIVAVIAAWTGVPFALWLAAVGMIGGAVAGIVGASNIGLAHTFHVNEGVGVLAAFAGAVIGALGGFLLIFVGYVSEPAQLLGAILSGLFIGGLGLWVIIGAESKLLSLRGYRRLSRREKEQLHTLLLETGYLMSLRVVPELWMTDSQRPEAFAHTRAIVVSKGLLDYDETEHAPRPAWTPGALGAILAHELHHWEMGDAVGDSMVWACFWPVVIAFNAGSWLQSKGKGLAVLGWFLFWPAWVTTKLIVVPLMAKQTRLLEYQADQRAASLGDEYRLGLRLALTELTEWEKPRTGWEQALAATHPPIELRLEKLEAPPQPEPAPAAARVHRVPAARSGGELDDAVLVEEDETTTGLPALTSAGEQQAQRQLADPPEELDITQAEAEEVVEKAKRSPRPKKLARTRAAASRVAPPRRRSKAQRADSVDTPSADGESAQPEKSDTPKKRRLRRAPAAKKTAKPAVSDADERWLPSKSQDGAATPASPRQRPRQQEPPEA